MAVGNVIFVGVKVAMALCGVANLMAGTVAVIMGEVTVAGVALPGGLILCLAANVDRFEVIKGLGIEAKVRKLDATLAAAQATLAQLRAVAELTGEVNIALLSKAGRWDGLPSPRHGYEVMVRTRDILRAVESDPATIDKVLAPWVHIFCFDLVRAISADIQDDHVKALKDLDAGLAAIPKPIDVQGSAFVDNTRRRRELGAERERLSSLWKIEDPATLWRELSKLLGELQFVTQETQSQARANVERFAPQVASLIAAKQLDSPREWIAAIDDHRARER